MFRDDSRILAIDPDIYRDWLSQLKESARQITPEVWAELRGPAAEARLQPGRKGVGDIAVVRLSGFITQKPTIMSLLFGGTSTEMLVAELRAAVAEPSVGAVLLDVSSPGGSVFGLPEAAAAIRALRGKKPMVAVSNPVMASAAYYLAAQLDEVVATPSSLTGSVGAISVYADESGALEQAGIKVEVFTHGRRKGEETGLGPLTERAREAIQARVDYYGAMFEADVAKGRGVSLGFVRSSFGEGAVFNADEAKRIKMVDQIATLEDVLGGLASGSRPKPRPVVAGADPVEIAARAALAGLTPGRSGVE